MNGPVVDLAAVRQARGGAALVALQGAVIHTVNGIAIGDRVALRDGQRGRVVLFRGDIGALLAVVFVRFRHVVTPAADLVRLFD